MDHKKVNPHSQLVNHILGKYGSNENLRLWKQHVGLFTTPWGSQVKIGVPGMSDIGGIQMGGRLIQIECKTGNAVQSKLQKLWAAMIIKFGGIFILARSLEDVERGLGVS